MTTCTSRASNCWSTDSSRLASSSTCAFTRGARIASPKVKAPTWTSIQTSSATSKPTFRRAQNPLRRSRRKAKGCVRHLRHRRDSLARGAGAHALQLGADGSCVPAQLHLRTRRGALGIALGTRIETVLLFEARDAASDLLAVFLGRVGFLRVPLFVLFRQARKLLPYKRQELFCRGRHKK